MHLSLAVLSKKAIEASLQLKWKEAIELNSTILKEYPNNTDAKIRLGRAYLQEKDFTKAKKMFKEVLKLDPINALALKNLELAKNGKSECPAGGSSHLNTKSLLKEPGTTHETKVPVKTKSIHVDDFLSGEELPIKIKRKSIDVYKIKKGKKILIGEITDNYIVQRVSHSVDKGEKVCISFVRVKDQDIWIIIKASAPIFKPDKLEIRPYLKKGTIEEPELEIEAEEEIE
ncbi:MAG: tetratricopeptide repeat protein [Patescibacteria group bacterium]